VQVVRDRIGRPGADGLGDLPVDQPGEGTGLDAYRVDAELGGDVRRAGEEEIPDQDRDRVAPAGVGARRAPPDLGLVHHVVVVERRQVGQLDDRRRQHHLPGAPGAELGRDGRQQRPEPLAPGVDQMPGRLGDQRVVTVDRDAQPLLDLSEGGHDRRLQLRVGEIEAYRGTWKRACHHSTIPYGSGAPGGRATG
jgi:hypothetical protein